MTVASVFWGARVTFMTDEIEDKGNVEIFLTPDK